MRMSSLGWGLWIFLALAIAIPIWTFWPGNHPLAAAGQVDLCAKIRPASDELVSRPSGFGGPSPQEARAFTGYCRLSFAKEAGSERERTSPQVLVGLTSQRTFANGDLRARTDRFMEVNVTEMKASGMAPEAIKGPWRTGVVVSSRGAQSVDVHIEDHGVLLLITTRNIPRENVIQFATGVAKALRQRG